MTDPDEITRMNPEAADQYGAREWRVALREVLAPVLADGARVTGFDRSGWYVVKRGSNR